MQMCVNEGIPRSWGGRVLLWRDGDDWLRTSPRFLEVRGSGSDLPCSLLGVGLDRVKASASASKEQSQQGAG